MALIAPLVLAGSCSGDGASATCLPVAEATVSAIETGLTVGGGGHLEGAAAVRSDEFSKVFMVSARIEGAGMEDAVGTWATNTITDSSGSFFAVPEMATEFSDFPDSSTTDAGIDQRTHGYDESRSCVD